MKKYIRIMRIDHWIKQLFVIPGCACAIFLGNEAITTSLFFKFLLGFVSTCLIASANYVINEWLDAEFDKYHPTKKYRSVVTEDVKGSVVWCIWGLLSVLGMCIGIFLGMSFAVMEALLWFMGIIYNVKPFRTKDIPFLDVISESVNNALRLLIGWFIIVDYAFPPCSIILGYWMGGAFLMAVKRYAEYRMIADCDLAGKYRKSFKYYTENSLLISAFFYALSSLFFVGIFLIKYKLELILVIPLLIGLFCYYLYLSFKPDSPVQKPEKLFAEKGLMIYCLIFIIVFVLLLFVKIPWLDIFATKELISI